MSARNLYHNDVIAALETDGWTITDDPLTLSYGSKDLYVDLGAERTAIAAERGTERIAVEIQSFLSRSQVRDLQEAIGQYQVYRLLLEQSEPDRRLFLAVPLHVYDGIFSERLGQLVVTQLKIRVLVFDEERRRIVQWVG